MLVGNIETERVRRGMSRGEVAERVGVPTGVYTDWVEGEAEIPCTAIAKMARLWGVTSDYLLGLAQRSVRAEG